MEQRLVDIELKVIGLEDTVQQLNEQVYEQRKQIDELRALCRILLQQNESSAEALRRAPADERPPHY